MTFVLTLIRRRPNKSTTKFNEIIKQNIEIPVEETQQTEQIQEPQETEQIPNEEIPVEPEQNIENEFEPPITDDLDLLLYNTHGNII